MPNKLILWNPSSCNVKLPFSEIETESAFPFWPEVKEQITNAHHSVCDVCLPNSEVIEW